ncbi:hypothetical protein B0H19DRAFT_1063003 [Mycena capillaripes]|nr:hypothetical protein B0H19DRAFT_1063003 [Mycena capillaripes]
MDAAITPSDPAAIKIAKSGLTAAAEIAEVLSRGLVSFEETKYSNINDEIKLAHLQFGAVRTPLALKFPRSLSSVQVCPRRAHGVPISLSDLKFGHLSTEQTSVSLHIHERQKLVANGFKQMVNTLRASGNFRPFVATMLMGWLDKEGRVKFEWQVFTHMIYGLSRTEAVPNDIRLVKDNTDRMYEWAEGPLQDYEATREDSAKGAPPIFPLTAEGLDDISPKVLAQTVTTYLAESHEAAFGTQEIPWAVIASDPDTYYDTAPFQLGFTLIGLADLTLSQWYELAKALVSAAGGGTSGFFRKPPPPPHREPTPTLPPECDATPPPAAPDREKTPTRPSPQRDATPPLAVPDREKTPTPPSPQRDATPPPAPPDREPTPTPPPSPHREPTPPPAPSPRKTRASEKKDAPVSPRRTRQNGKRMLEDKGPGGPRKRARKHTTNIIDKEEH